jgi:hypothetical protein
MYIKIYECVDKPKITPTQVFERDTRHTASIFSNEDMPQPTPVTSQRRGSKLGQSLYCIRDCRKVLPIDKFPIDNISIYKECADATTNRRGHAPPNQHNSDLEHGLQDSVSRYNRRISLLPRSHGGNRRPYHAYEDSNKRRAGPLHRTRHSTLSSSVTTFSDVGGYNSGRSTYSIPRSSQKKRGQRQKSQITLRGSRLAPEQRDRSINRRLEEVKGTLQYFTVDNNSDVQQRNVYQINEDSNSEYRSRTEDCDYPSKPEDGDQPTQLQKGDLLKTTFPCTATPHINRCLIKIYEA